MYESLGSQFFRTTTEIQSGPSAFDESRLVMTYLSNLGVTKICSFRLVLGRKTGKGIPYSARLKFLENLLANNCTLAHAEDSISRSLNRGSTADLPLLRTLLAICLKSCELSFWEVIGFCFISICKFGSFKNLIAAITSLSEH